MNFLPLEKKIEIKREYLRRFLVVLGSIFSFIILMAIILLVPVYILLEGQKTSLNFQLSLLERRASDIKKQGNIDEIENLKKQLSILSKEENFSIPKILNEIVIKKTSGISIISISINKNNVIMGGISSTRSALVNFLDELKKDNVFKSVNAPPSNFIRDKNIEFSINLEIEYEK